MSPSLLELLFTEERNVFAPPRFGITVFDDMELVMFDADLFKKSAPEFRHGAVDALAWTVGSVSIRRHETDCLTAMSIARIASNPKYGGAGMAMYALASSYWDGPITSDRQHSSSVAARKAWDKIAASGEFKRLTNFDNYATDTSGNKTYVDLQPGGKFTPLQGPKTPGTVDDCPLPEYDPTNKSVARSATLTGTDAAWKYTGPLNARALEANGHKVVSEIMQQYKMTETQVLFWIDSGAGELWATRYKGIETTG